MLRCYLIAVILALAVPSLAEEADEETKPLAGNIKFGLLATSGNTETKTMNTGAEATYTLERWIHSAKAAAIYAEDSEVTTAEAYEASWRTDWTITDRDSVFGRLSWRKDRFGPFDTQFSQTLGYGRKILTGETHFLNADVGVGARQSQDQLGVDNDEFIVTGGVDYTWKFSETAEFGQTIDVEAGEDNTFSEAVTSVSTTLIGAFRLVASYTLRHNTDAPPGTDKRDTRTAISLEYNF